VLARPLNCMSSYWGRAVGVPELAYLLARATNCRQRRRRVPPRTSLVHLDLAARSEPAGM